MGAESPSVMWVGHRVTQVLLATSWPHPASADCFSLQPLRFFLALHTPSHYGWNQDILNIVFETLGLLQNRWEVLLLGLGSAC